VSGTNQAVARQLIGHEWATTLLMKHINTGQVRHAYLISGEDGVGKRTLALRFAQALNCINPDDSGEPCGDCRACTLIQSVQHPDFHEVVPEDDSNSLKVDQVRELQHQLALSPFEGKWRIALLPDFEQATESAANALLKTLEEPADRVIVILTAIDATSLLPTIVSRCEHIPLRTVSTETIEQAILGQGVKEDLAELIAVIAQGRPGWAIRYKENPDLLNRRVESIEQLAELLHQSRGDRFDFVDRILPRKHDLETQRRNILTILHVWMGVWRDALQHSYKAQGNFINPDQHQLIGALNQKLDPKQIHDIVTALQSTQKAIERFANIRLAMEVLMLKLPYLG
jgi:DNA polymerase-3 subunit delta'